MPSADQLRRAIQPGSMEYGDRQGFENNLGSALGQGSAPAPAGQPVTPLPTSADPLGMMLGGQLKPDNGPLTSGLSVGPGPGATPAPASDEMSDRLLYLAENASTPMLRYRARQALRARYLARES